MGVQGDPWVKGQSPLRDVGAGLPHVGDLSELEASRTPYYAFSIIFGRPPLLSSGWEMWKNRGGEEGW